MKRIFDWIPAFETVQKTNICHSRESGNGGDTFYCNGPTGCRGKLVRCKTENQQNAEIYVASLLSGYLNFLPKDGNNRFVDALKDLSTEGGLNTQLSNHNKEGGMLERLETGMQALETD